MRTVGAISMALFVLVGFLVGTGGTLGLWVILALALLAAIRIADRPRRWYPAQLYFEASALILVGALARYEVLFRFYGGGGDSVRYYNAGLIRAQELWNSPLVILTPDYWSLRGSRWGTGFIEQISGIVLTVIGETLRGEFIVFAFAGFLGSFLIVKSYRWVNSVERSLACAMLVWLWPSVWYWPSSVGKESLILLSFGLATYGYVGDGVRYRWGYLAAGLGLSFLIRPHVTAVLIMSMVAANVLEPVQGRLTNRRVVQFVVTGILAVVVLQAAVSRLGLADTDLEGMVEFAAYTQAQTASGGSNIGAPSGVLAPGQAVINLWFRPFPWEVRSVPSAASAAEILLLLGVVWYRRRELRTSLRYWRHHRMLRFAIVLLAAYTLMLGLSFSNLGIIARQRAPMFPFLLIMLMGAEQPTPVAAHRRHRTRLGRARAGDTYLSTGHSPAAT